MSYKDVLTANGTSSWPIGLATHLGTPISNETTEPSLRQNSLRARKEQQFSAFTRSREPIAGYNCFGHVLANRRTAIYWDDDAVDLETVLCEDGYGEITDENLLQVGDIVVYSDDRGPKHVAVIIRLDSISNVSDGPRVPIVVSKFGDHTGEYEHAMNVTTWDDPRWRNGELVVRKYRPRYQTPRRKPPSGWRAVVQGIVSP